MKPMEVSQFLKTNVTLFQHFDETELLTLVEESRIAAFEPNEFIIEFGEKGWFLGVMLNGEAQMSVTQDNGERKVLTTLNPGEPFGEISLMTGDLTIGDVICSKASRVLLIPNDLFSSKIITNPQALQHLSKILAKHLKAMSENIEGNEAKTGALIQSSDPYGLDLQTNEPVKLLIINCGSSSLKFHFIDTMDQDNSAKGSVERIHLENTQLTYKSANANEKKDLGQGDHKVAFEAMLEILTDKKVGVVANLDDITCVAHRSTLGGEKHRGAVFITEEVIEDMDQYSDVFPLHNPPIINGIRLSQTLLPKAIHVTVFDSSFHATVPSFAYLYALPYEYYEEKGIRRFGYHGSSHKYASLKTAQYLKRPFNKLETIICHLGNGSSVCGVDHGRSVDTTMGFSPLEGLIMGTRCGDLDPGVILHLMREGMGYDELNELLNKKSGLLGISGVSSDMREIEAAADDGNHRAMLAIKTYAYKVRKYIGSYVAAMEGLDALVFTGGIGQGSALIRSLACQGLHRMGITIDEKKNRNADGFKEICDISTEDSLVRVLIIPADEERMIARDTLATLERLQVIGVMKSQKPMPVPIEISAHHVHLSREHVEALFGKDYKLANLKTLGIPSAFACEEKINLVGPKGRVNNVRILGPERKETQVEISMTEQYKLGIHPPIRESGDLDGTPGITLEGPKGKISIEKGVICAMRHIHAKPEDVLKMGIKDKDVVRVQVQGDRELIFGDVMVRVHPDFNLYMHIDTDEANAANLRNGTIGYVESIQLRN
jgi:acetate kinase